MAAEASIPVIKLVLLGATSTGKSSLCERLVRKSFRAGSVPSTIGAAFASYLLADDGKEPVKLEIWDTAGQEQFSSLAPMYYKRAGGALLVFDVTNTGSFSDVERWHAELLDNGPDGVAIVVCGNKVDLANADPSLREIETEDAESLAADIGATYVETSAKDGIGVREAFRVLADEVLRRERAAAGEFDSESDRDDGLARPRDRKITLDDGDYPTDTPTGSARSSGCC
jgi:small GTP-binding protein